jgi:site-specific DNA-methyltransferase (adenine-specific)
VSRIEQLAEGVTLYCGDSREILPTLGPEHLTTKDVIVTDPPYGIALQTKNAGRDQRPYQKAGDIVREAKTKKHDFDAIIGDDKPFDPSDLLLFPNLVLWGANNFADRLPISHCWFSWDKKCGKAADSDIGDCELAWTRGIRFKTVRAFRHMWAGFQRDSEVGGVRYHPTQKPIALMRWCIEFFPQSNVVLDPFMGSGSTGIAAVKLGRRFIGIELEPKYFDIAVRRISDALKQPDFFVEQPKPVERETFATIWDKPYVDAR